MKKGSYYIFTLLYVLIGASIFLTPSNIIYAQDDAVEEIFWGDDEEGDFDEEFDFSEDDELYFFGDRMEKGGNDYSLGQAVKERGGYTYHVNNWTDTRTILEGIQH